MNKNILIGAGIVVIIGIGALFITQQKQPERISQVVEKTEMSAEAPMAAEATQAPTGKMITLAEVEAHKDAADCWTAINGKVYDLTAFVTKHPGGDKNILKICGMDGSTAFTGKHGMEEKPNQALSNFVIGELSQ